MMQHGVVVTAQEVVERRHAPRIAPVEHVPFSGACHIVSPVSDWDAVAPEIVAEGRLGGHVGATRWGARAVPTWFHALWRSPKMPYVITMEITTMAREPEINRVNVERTLPTVGEPITGGLLRDLPLGRMLRAALEVAARPLEEVHGEEVPGGAFRVPGVTPPGSAEVGNRPQLPGRGRSMDRDTLAAVASVYLAAQREGRAPTQAVADVFGTSRSSAGRVVVQARRAGLLPPARGTATER